LLISAAAKSARCHLVPEKLRRGVEHPFPLLLRLKKVVEGARLVASSSRHGSASSPSISPASWEIRA